MSEDPIAHCPECRGPVRKEYPYWVCHDCEQVYTTKEIIPTEELDWQPPQQEEWR